jgi:1-acyl-sn-glycerol-3-phosphate acyltransferase
VIKSTASRLVEKAFSGGVGAVSSVLSTLRDTDLDACIDAVSRDNLNAYGYDKFGYSPDYVKGVMPALAFMHRHYFRVKSYGIENVPSTGRALLVSNHSGQLPFDGAMIGASMLLDAKPPRMVRAMVERWVPTLPFASVFMARCGQVVGSPENCRSLLADEECILVFPEGAGGISKTYDKRYELQRFGSGFMRLAIEMNAPIIPIGVVGAEEQAPALWNWEAGAKVLGAPALPITPLTPFLGPAGALPMPVRYHIHFGKPIHVTGSTNEDDGSIGRRIKRVKNEIRGLLDTGLKQRDGIFR